MKNVLTVNNTLRILLIVVALVTSFGISYSQSNAEEISVQRIRELEERRTYNEKHYVNSDGTITAVIHASSVHYKDEEGKFQDIDTTMLAIEDLDIGQKRSALQSEGFAKGVVENTYHSFFPNVSNRPARFEVGDGWIQFKPIGGRNVHGKVSGAAITYEGVWLDADLRYTVEPDRLKEDIILHSHAAPSSFSFRYQLQGLEVRQENGRISFVDKEGEEKFFISNLYMEDAEGNYSQDVQVTITQTGNTGVIEIIPDENWLKDPQRVYPVVVDPTYTTTRVAVADSYVTAYHPNSNFGSSTRLEVGDNKPLFSNWVRQRSYLWFNVSNIRKSIQVQDAKVRLYYYSHTNNNVNVAARRVTNTWDEMQITWSNQPSNDGINQSVTTVVSGQYGWYEFPLCTDMVEGWIKETEQNHGVVLRQENEGQQITRLKYFYSREYSTSSLRPRLEITYVDEITLTPTYPEPGQWINDPSPTLQWDYSHLDGKNQSHYQISAWEWYYYTDYYATGEVQSSANYHEVTNILSDGWWDWGIRVKDGDYWSQWRWTFFNIDTYTPDPPLITSSGDSYGKVNLIEWDDPQDFGLSGKDYFEVQCDVASNFCNPLIKTTENNSVTFTGLSEGVTYFYRVRAIDNAGNYGSWSSVTQSEQLPEAYNWWDDDFGYRREIILSNNLSWVKENEPVALWVHSPNIKEDGADIRLIHDNTEVPFRILEADNVNNNYKIVFEIGAIDPHTYKKYYVYYGNEHAAPASTVSSSTNYTLQDENQYYSWYTNESKVWTINTSIAVELFTNEDAHRESISLSDPIKFFGSENITSIRMNSNGYLSTSWPPASLVIPDEGVYNLIRAENLDLITSGYHREDNDYNEFIWDGHLSGDQNQEVLSAVRIYNDGKIYILTENYYVNAITQIENPSMQIGPGTSDYSNYVSIFVYKPVEKYICYEQELAEALPVEVAIITPTGGEVVKQGNPTLYWSYDDDLQQPQSDYHVQVSSSTDFTNIYDDSGVVASDNKYYSVNNNLTAGLWHWRVKAKNGSVWSLWDYGTFNVVLTLEDGAISINDGVQFTNNVEVAICLSKPTGISGQAYMSFSNDGQAWTQWYDYQSIWEDWTLEGGDGNKTVYVKYKDDSQTEYGPYTDSIILDETPPTVPSGLVAQAVYIEPNLQTEFSWDSSTDNLSGVDGYFISIYDLSDTPVQGYQNVFTENTYYIFNSGIGESYYAKVRAKDVAGNLSQWSNNSNTVGATSSTISRTYDDEGNMRTIAEDDGQGPVEIADLDYNSFNRLIFYDDIINNIEISYAYDGNMVRKQKSVTEGASTDVTKYVHSRGMIIAELDGSDNLTARNIHGINLISRQDNQSNVAYYIYNGHGDVVDLINPQGVSIITYDYDAFGNLLEEDGTGFDNPFKFAGELLDSETGYYIMGARYYAPSLGRWISEDAYRGEITDPLSLNLYVFCINNPLIYVDPTGHWPEWLKSMWQGVKDWWSSDTGENGDNVDKELIDTSRESMGDLSTENTWTLGYDWTWKQEQEILPIGAVEVPIQWTLLGIKSDVPSKGNFQFDVKGDLGSVEVGPLNTRFGYGSVDGKFTVKMYDNRGSLLPEVSIGGGIEGLWFKQDIDPIQVGPVRCSAGIQSGYAFKLEGGIKGRGVYLEQSKSLGIGYHYKVWIDIIAVTTGTLLPVINVFTP